MQLLLMKSFQELSSSEYLTLTEKDEKFMEWLFIEPLPRNGTIRVMKLLDTLEIN
jgi:hypothetical protein